MRVERIDRLAELERLKPDWDAVYEADPEAQFFLSWQWLRDWLAALGKDWFVLVARSGDGPAGCAAILPLRIATREEEGGGFVNEINPAGNYVSDYTGILCRPEHESQAIPLLARHVTELAWARLNLDYVRASEHRMALLLREFPAGEFVLTPIDRVNRDGIDNNICPYVPLAADWETYLETRLSANARQKLRRLLRQLDGSDEFRITHADGETFERDLETLLALWTRQWGGRKGKLLPKIVTNCRLMLPKCFAAGTLLLPVLWQRDKPIAALAVLTDHKKKVLHFYLAGRDTGFTGASPGLALHAHTIRYAVRNGFVEYDFLRGNESYKYSFGVAERRCVSLVVATPNGKNRGDRLDPSSLPFVLRQSMKHHRAGRIAQAEIGYRQMLEVQPANADALYALGQVAAARGDHAEAVRHFETLVANRPEIGRAWRRLGRSRLACGDLPAAADAYCEAIERDGATPELCRELGQVLLKLGLVDHALATFDVVHRLIPGAEGSLPTGVPRPDGTLGTPPHLPPSHAGLAGRVSRLAAVAAVMARRRAGDKSTGASA